MNFKTRCTLLGTGSSGGVPRVGGDWGVCDPEEPKNRRRRCCVLIEKQDAKGERTSILIDTSPDLREQLLDAGVTSLDALIYTHEHADQVHGIDDIRPLVIRRRAPLPTYMNAATRDILTRRFDYCFEGKGGYPPILDLQPDIIPEVPFTVGGSAGDIQLMPLDMEHGRIRCLGFRVQDFAYCNDVSDLPAASKGLLKGLDTLVIDALRYTDHPTHANVAKALDWVAELKPRRTVLTNMHVDLDYQTLKRELPAHVEPGFDGMVLEII
ncbi:MBL fold metallo-hydrolase [uncultured Hyphomonas sp.]|uniref:MBL fold metallo-hydrolase n=1 Tax=uncultured Hyphomonas sp. TaxID=225298 RepID=UPI002AAC0A37|nr:MBL fold metallo-hydrolase [uncultured Hyphomonas sp.]